jgi:hypothetical protein
MHARSGDKFDPQVRVGAELLSGHGPIHHARRELVLCYATYGAGLTPNTLPYIDYHHPVTMFGRFGHGTNQFPLHSHVVVFVWVLLNFLEYGQFSDGPLTSRILWRAGSPIFDDAYCRHGNSRTHQSAGENEFSPIHGFLFRLHHMISLGFKFRTYVVRMNCSHHL